MKITEDVIDECTRVWRELRKISQGDHDAVALYFAAKLAVAQCLDAGTPVEGDAHFHLLKKAARRLGKRPTFQSIWFPFDNNRLGALAIARRELGTTRAAISRAAEQEGRSEAAIQKDLQRMREWAAAIQCGQGVPYRERLVFDPIEGVFRREPVALMLDSIRGNAGRPRSNLH